MRTEKNLLSQKKKPIQPTNEREHKHKFHLQGDTSISISFISFNRSIFRSFNLLSFSSDHSKSDSIASRRKRNCQPELKATILSTMSAHILKIGNNNHCNPSAIFTNRSISL